MKPIDCTLWRSHKYSFFAVISQEGRLTPLVTAQHLLNKHKNFDQGASGDSLNDFYGGRRELIVLSSHSFFSAKWHPFISSFHSIIHPMHMNGRTASQAPGTMLGTEDIKNWHSLWSKGRSIINANSCGRAWVPYVHSSPSGHIPGRKNDFSNNLYILSFKEMWSWLLLLLFSLGITESHTLLIGSPCFPGEH